MSRAYKPSFSIQPEQSSMLRIPEAALWEFQRYFQGLVERPLLIVGFKDPPPAFTPRLRRTPSLNASGRFIPSSLSTTLLSRGSNEVTIGALIIRIGF